MARRKDSPAEQAAKGFPGKRKSKVERAAAEMLARAEAIAKQALASSDPFEPPPLLTESPIYFADGILAWRDLVQAMRAKGRLDASYVQMMALWAVTVNRWARALRDVIRHGDSQRIKTISGSFRVVDNPAQARADDAEKRLSDLARAFGLAPLFDHDLMKVQSFNRGRQDELPLPEPSQGVPSQPAAPPQTPADDPFGFMSRADSPPPKSTH